MSLELINLQDILNMMGMLMDNPDMSGANHSKARRLLRQAQKLLLKIQAAGYGGEG